MCSLIEMLRRRAARAALGFAVLRCAAGCGASGDQLLGNILGADSGSQGRKREQLQCPRKERMAPLGAKVTGRPGKQREQQACQERQIVHVDGIATDRNAQGLAVDPIMGEPGIHGSQEQQKPHRRIIGENGEG